MQPLIDKIAEDHKIHDAKASMEDESRRLMPRLVRRLVRSIQAPKVSALMSVKSLRNAALVGGLLAAGIYTMSDSEVSHTALASLSSHTGLTANKLVLNGNQNLDVTDIKGLVGVSLGKPMLSIDVADLQNQLEASRWIKKASIRKAYPETLVVDIEERQPVALWKSGETLIVISPDGYAIDKANQKFMHLPQVVGEGANEAASDFLLEVNRYPELVGRMDAYVRVASRRWNLILDDGPSVLLPAEGWQKALAKLNKLQMEDQILDRDITHVDMRLPDRLVLRLPHDAAIERREILENALKRKWHRT